MTRKLKITPTEGPAKVTTADGSVLLRAHQLADNEERTRAKRKPSFRGITRREMAGWTVNAAFQAAPKDLNELAGWLAREIFVSGTWLD